MDFEQAESYVGSLLKFGINLGLESIDNFLRNTGYSWEGMKFIHVGGTNGKGSTAAMIAGILRHAGYRVGLYSSPHIETYRERMAVNGSCISQKDFSEIVTGLAARMDVLKEAERLTEFEFLTVIALEHFRRARVEIAVMEVGMGGRFDATNIIPCPEVSVITNVTRDHVQYLGSDLLSIAGEKAGIIKARGCLVTAEESSEIRRLFMDRCKELGCRFRFVGDEVQERQDGYEKSSGEILQKCHIFSSSFHLERLRLRMLGRHQVVNAATALLAAQVLVEKGIAVSAGHIRAGLESIMIPGRIEVLAAKPLVILDAAHNAAGIEALKQTLLQVADGSKLVLVTGMLDDKEQDVVAGIWGSMPSQVIITRPDSGRSANWKQLGQYFRKYIENVQEIEDIGEAVVYGWSLVGENDILCTAGSFYVLRRARQKIEKLIALS